MNEQINKLTLEQAVTALKEINHSKLEIAIKALEVIKEDSETLTPHMLGMIAQTALIVIAETPE